MKYPKKDLKTHNIMAMAKSVLSEDIDWSQFESLRELIPEQAEFFEFTNYDRRWCDFYAKVAAKTCLDFDEPRTDEERMIDNFYGLLGEKAVKDSLRRMQVIFNYNEREPEFFEKTFKEPFDFAVASKNGDYITLELKTTKEHKNQKNLIIKEGTWKKSDYAIAVKMLSITTDLADNLTKVYGAIAGYLTKQEISKLRIRDNEYPCYKHPCRAMYLNKISHPISELWDIINSKATHWHS